MGSSHKYFSLFIFIFFFTVMYGITAVHGSEGESITRQHTFTSTSKDDTGDEFPRKVIKDGKTYIFEDVNYEVVKKKELKEKKRKTITVTSDEVNENSDYTPEKKITRNNVTYKLKSMKREEKVISGEGRRKVTGYIDYDNKDAAENAPNVQKFTANGATADCKKKSMEELKASGWEDSYINLTFVSDSKDYYEWNGIQIDGKAKNPLKDYETEILKSIGADVKNYRVKNTYWDGKAYQKDGMYYRKAKVDIQKKIPHYRVHYEGYSKPEEKKVYIYKSTYEATVKEPTGEKLYTINATAVYREKVQETTKQAVTVKKETPRIVRVGIILFSLIITGVLFIIYFKSGKEKKAK